MYKNTKAEIGVEQMLLDNSKTFPCFMSYLEWIVNL